VKLSAFSPSDIFLPNRYTGELPIADPNLIATYLFEASFTDSQHRLFIFSATALKYL